MTKFNHEKESFHRKQEVFNQEIQTKSDDLEKRVTDLNAKERKYQDDKSSFEAFLKTETVRLL